MNAKLSDIVSNNDHITPTASLHVEVIADFACPFSFLGKRRLDRALVAVKGPSDVSWYPFQLNPDVPTEGMPFDAYLTKRFGSPANIEPVLDYLGDQGRALGIKFRFDAIRQVPNTVRAHQLMQLAETAGADRAALADDLFSSFFEQGKDIGDRGALIEIAKVHGLGAGEVIRAIDSDQLRQVVVTREAQVRASGLTATPGFLLNRRLLVVGAQETDTIVNAFDRAMFGEGTDMIESPALH
ncbi:MAG: DsbA family oxidoreductase [Pseudomonadota bacterium]